MAEGFWKGLREHALYWSGWVFTVGGAAVALWLGKEYWWLWGLVVLVGLLALFGYSAKLHRDLREAEGRHQAEVSRLDDHLRAATQRAQAAEQKLNEVPLQILARLESVIVRHSFTELVRLLEKHADFVGRMKAFAEAAPKLITVRKIQKQAGGLYVIGKAGAEALQHVRIGDPFVLTRTSPEGPQTNSARLVVHQPPNPAKEVVVFQIVRFLTDEMAHLEKYAESYDVEGLKGYNVRPDSDPECYTTWDFPNLASSIARLAQDLQRNPQVRDD